MQAKNTGTTYTHSMKICRYILSQASLFEKHWFSCFLQGIHVHLFSYDLLCKQLFFVLILWFCILIWYLLAQYFSNLIFFYKLHCCIILLYFRILILKLGHHHGLLLQLLLLLLRFSRFTFIAQFYHLMYVGQVKKWSKCMYPDVIYIQRLSNI